MGQSQMNLSNETAVHFSAAYPLYVLLELLELMSGNSKHVHKNLIYNPRRILEFV